MTDPCPDQGCGYTSNMRQVARELELPLSLETTRSRSSADAYRDMDGFDVDEELARLRRAVAETKHVGPKLDPELYRFIVEAFSNIDEHLLRMGDLPRSWWAAALETELPTASSTDEPDARCPRAAAADPLGDLNHRLTQAILEAERITADGPKRARAYLEVSRLEEHIAGYTNVSDIERDIARVGAVTAALLAHDPQRAGDLASTYLGNDLADHVRAELETLVGKAKDAAGPWALPRAFSWLRCLGPRSEDGACWAIYTFQVEAGVHVYVRAGDDRSSSAADLIGEHTTERLAALCARRNREDPPPASNGDEASSSRKSRDP